MRLRREDLAIAVFCLILGGSLLLNVFQYRWRTATDSAAPAGFAEASTLPSLPFETPSGGFGVLTFDTDTLVYVFAPGCSWCKQDYPSVDAIRRATEGRLRFVAITRYGDNPPAEYLKTLSGYLAEHSYPTVGLVKGDQLGPQIARGLGLTPQLLFVRRGGRIAKAWHGAMGERLRDAETYLAAALAETRSGVSP